MGLENEQEQTFLICVYSKICLKRPLKKKTNNWYPRPIIIRSKVLHNAPREAFCKNFEFIKLPFVIKIFVLSIIEWPLKTGFTVKYTCICKHFTFANSVDSDLPAVVIPPANFVCGGTPRKLCLWQGILFSRYTCVCACVRVCVRP